MCEKLIQFIDAIRGGQICTLTAFSAVKMNKGRKDKETGLYPNAFVDSNGEPLVRMVTTKQIRLGRYDSIMERRTGEEFESAPLWGGAGVHLSRSIVQHTETQETYLAYTPESTILRQTQWNNGTELTADELLKLDEWRTPSKPSEAVVAWEICKLSNVISLRAAGETFYNDE